MDRAGQSFVPLPAACRLRVYPFGFEPSLPRGTVSYSHAAQLVIPRGTVSYSHAAQSVIPRGTVSYPTRHSQLSHAAWLAQSHRQLTAAPLLQAPCSGAPACASTGASSALGMDGARRIVPCARGQAAPRMLLVHSRLQCGHAGAALHAGRHCLASCGGLVWHWSADVVSRALRRSTLLHAHTVARPGRVRH